MFVFLVIICSLLVTPIHAILESFPFLHGKYLLYKTYMWVYPATVLFITAGGSFIIYVCLACILGMLDQKHIPREEPPDIEATRDDSTRALAAHSIRYGETDEAVEVKPRRSVCIKILAFTAGAFRFLAALSFFLAFVFLGMFDGVPIEVSFFITWFVLWAYLLHFYVKPVMYPRSIESMSCCNRCCNKVRHHLILLCERHKYAALITGIISLAICLTIALVTNGGCLAVFSQQEGGFVLYTYDNAPAAVFSTAFSRSLLPKPCPPGKGPCHIYLTLATDTSTSVFVNAHFPPGIPGATVVYNSTDGDHKQATMTVFPVPELESNGARDVHTVLLESLSGGTVYNFFLQWTEGNNQYTSDVKKFRTNPNDGGGVTFVMGGDSGVNNIVGVVNSQAAEHNPAFSVIGGDITYGNGMFTCYRCWDAFFNLWDQYMTTPDGLMIPIIGPVGNHDVGSNALSQAKQDPNHPVLYFQYLPQHQGSNINIPAPQDRLTYFYHLIGNHTVLISLDSGHVAPPDGAQQDFLQKLLSSPEIANKSLKIVVYHVPIYSSKGDWNASDFSLAARQYWVDLFDKYDVAVVFENHVHEVKRSRPLTNSEIDISHGTVYFGDGKWGATKHGDQSGGTAITNNDMGGRLAFTADVYHFWKVEVGYNGMTANFTAIAPDGQAIDSAQWTKLGHGTYQWTNATK